MRKSPFHRFRWGTSLLPGDTITMELLLDQTAIYLHNGHRDEGQPHQDHLEDVCDNLFNPDHCTISKAGTWSAWGLQYDCDP